MSDNGKLKTVELPATITVRELAQAIDASPIEIIKTLMANGVMANINQQVDFDTAAIVAAEMGYDATLETPEIEDAQDVGEIPLWRQLIADEPADKLKVRAPVVTILGHVDHGKTTLLDAIRNTDVASGEVGGITQHIGAYQVEHNKQTITFLDTPGHSAFTAMRARGAQGADIVVLVIAADDGVMPQTKEAAAHAKAAKVPIIVAMNKIDKSNADPDKVKRQLAEIELVPDEWGGDTLVVPISAKQREGVDDLLEAILLVADSMDIQANPNGKVLGTVIEAELDKTRGPLATLLIQNGTVNMGDRLIVGDTYGRIKAMFDYRLRSIKKAGPSTPIYIMGLSEVPAAGDIFQTVASEKEGRAIIAKRRESNEKDSGAGKESITLEQLFDNFRAGKTRELRLIIKADVQGSLEPLISSLNDMSTNELKVNILQASTGNITENDVMLATASKAIVLGFSVSADSAAKNLAESESVSIRIYDIIYRMLEDVEKAITGMLKPETKEVILGNAEVRAIFRVSKVGAVAGCRVTQGELRRNGKMRVLRNGKLVHQGDVGSLKRVQEDVREVRQGFECGVSIKNFDAFEVGDTLECFIIEKNV